MVSEYGIIPVGCLIMAIIFSPNNLNINPNGGSLIFTTGVTYQIGLNGITYNQYNATTATPTQCAPPGVNSIPVLHSVWDIFAAIGAGLSQVIQNNPFVPFGLPPSPIPTPVTQPPPLVNFVNNTSFIQNCLAQAGTILSFNYSAQDFYLIFIQLIVIVGFATVVASIFTQGAAPLVMFIIGAFASVWVVLSLAAFPTFSIIPNPWGATIYLLLTLGFSLFTIDTVGGGKVF